MSRRHQVMSFLIGLTVGGLVGLWTDLLFSGLFIGLMTAAAYVQYRTRPEDPELSFWHANTQWRTPFRVLVNVLAIVALVTVIIATHDYSRLIQYSALGLALACYWGFLYVVWRRDVRKRIIMLNAAPAPGNLP